MATETISAFLPYTTSQKAVSLIIAKSDLLADEAIDDIKVQDVKEMNDVRDLEQGGTHYVRLSKDNAKEMYDVAVQYGSGQITYFDRAVGRTVWINPRYESSALIFIVTEQTLNGLEDSGLYLRSVTGLATQL